MPDDRFGFSASMVESRRTVLHPWNGSLRPTAHFPYPWNPAQVNNQVNKPQKLGQQGDFRISYSILQREAKQMLPDRGLIL
jgi:hypothetical protein